MTPLTSALSFSAYRSAILKLVEIIKHSFLFFKKGEETNLNEDRRLKFESNLTSVLSKYMRALLANINRFYFTNSDKRKKRRKKSKFYALWSHLNKKRFATYHNYTNTIDEYFIIPITK
jgi:hypothetical protein